MSSFALKLLALILMLIDHIGEFIPGAPIWLNWLGRLSAPLFLFCVAQGLEHTHDRKKYCQRLYIGAAGMGVGSFLVQALVGRQEWRISNSVFETLFLVCVIVTIVDLLRKKQKEGKRYLIIFLVVQASSLALCAACYRVLPAEWADIGMELVKALLPNVLLCEGSIIVVALGLVMYYLRNKRWTFCITYIVFSVLMGVAIAPNETLFTNLFFLNFQWMMVFSLPLMLAYNGKRGRSMKWLFYLFYPIHIWVLYLIGAVMQQYIF